MARSWSRLSDSSDGRLTLRTAHHTIKAPLVLETADVPTFSWYAGEFWRPTFDNPCPHAQAKDTIGAFLNEDLIHAAAYVGEELVAVGLVQGSEWTRWHLNFDRIELRSWHGTYDADVVVDPQALDWAQLPVA